MAEENKKEQKQEKKIIVDEDWKNQAEQEKEKLSEKEKKKKEQKHSEGPETGRRGPLPKGDFAALLSMLTTQTLFALGALKVQGQEDKEPDLELARYHIDMLQTLEEKTKGNLSQEEQKVFENTLNQVRMTYVKISESK